jgi:hypothetical protein
VGAERMLGYTAAEVMNKITPAQSVMALRNLRWISCTVNSLMMRPGCF